MRRPWTSLAAAGLAVWIALQAAGVADVVSTDLPDRLTHEELWQLGSRLSEEGASFISDNLVSNEMSFAQVIPEIAAWGVKGGVYLGVGPEQNFTYLEAMRARMGFILDIRRESLLQHLLYKALFELSPSRSAFVANLFSRPGLNELGAGASASSLMDALVRAPGGTADEHQAIVDRVRHTLSGYRFPLTAADFTTIGGIQRAFHEYGPDISYSTTLLKRPLGSGSFVNLMRQVDSEGRELGFLATDEAYAFVRDLHARNLVVPVVGNFAGAKALRGIGQYVRERHATISAFYVSNVEDYLGRERSVPRNGEWSAFCENVATLPLDRHSVFIRPLGLAKFYPTGHLRVSRDMHIVSNEADVYPPGARPVLPRALSEILPEVGQCTSDDGRPARTP